MAQGCELQRSATPYAYICFSILLRVANEAALRIGSRLDEYQWAVKRGEVYEGMCADFAVIYWASMAVNQVREKSHATSSQSLAGSVHETFDWEIHVQIDTISNLNIYNANASDETMCLVQRRRSGCGYVAWR